MSEQSHPTWAAAKTLGKIADSLERIAKHLEEIKPVKAVKKSPPKEYVLPRTPGFLP